MFRLRRPTVATIVTLLLSLTVFSSVALPAAEAGCRVNRFAAIAYSPLTGRYGYTSGAFCLADATAGAIANCCAPDARVVVWVENGWAAFARSRNGTAISYGVSTR
jgi:hypothetical protein